MRPRAARLALAMLAATGCASAAPVGQGTPAPGAVANVPDTAGIPSRRYDLVDQLVVVTTIRWDTVGGTLRRYERGPDRAWRAVGGYVPVVVGRNGLAWGDAGAPAPTDAPVKREGDGRAPAGAFPLDTLFGFAPATGSGWARLPYLPLVPGHECVDDGASAHYNTVVHRDSVARVDWTSAERMREIDQYRLGVIVGYNRPPRAGRGSCIFLHVWGGSGVGTAGCTAMDERDLRDVALWLDRARRPTLVQLTDAEYARVRVAWGLP